MERCHTLCFQCVCALDTRNVSPPHCHATRCMETFRLCAKAVCDSLGCREEIVKISNCAAQSHYYYHYLLLFLSSSSASSLLSLTLCDDTANMDGRGNCCSGLTLLLFCLVFLLGFVCCFVAGVSFRYCLVLFLFLSLFYFVFRIVFCSSCFSFQCRFCFFMPLL